MKVVCNFDAVQAMCHVQMFTWKKLHSLNEPSETDTLTPAQNKLIYEAIENVWWLGLTSAYKSETLQHQEKEMDCVVSLVTVSLLISHFVDWHQVVSGTEWLEFSDFVEQAVLQRQSYILQGYSPFLSVAFHLFYASQAHSKLRYPSSQYEVHKTDV